ncbi:hypothetical protein EGH25_08410 [Haladaptatus sp. F3-133]|jgi:hypothetical protein|uniref:Uncharacterized protein n=1 Tax=Halorutilus salinus TaxID=2487751 RepID=A0A9Q4C3U9_9EURY|nr:hypothetical protein [Halorutilus salinus]MCX2819372.1 hypothetical protein [Halorutilus salinus]
METDVTGTRSYRTSDDRLVIYDAEEPCAYLASSVCVGLDESA